MSRLIGPGAIGAAGPTSEIHTTPFPHRLGEVSHDREGNEFLYCQFSAAVFGGILVSIDHLYRAVPLLGTALLPGRVGVAMTGATSVNAGWVQIYGTHLAVQTSTASDGVVSDQTVGYSLIAQTSVSSPSGTLSFALADTTAAQNMIYGMWLAPMATVSDIVAGGPTSGVSGPSTEFATNATSTTGSTYVVCLNYPYVTGVAASLVTSNS